VSREEVGARLARLIAMVPWMAARPEGTTVDELAARFDTSVARVEKDLHLLGEVEPEAQLNVSMYEEDGRWFVDSYGHLAQPFRITAGEAFGLMVAARSILQVRGVDASGPLVSAIAKVARAVGGDVDGLEIHLPRPPALDALQGAVERSAVVEIEYYSAGRDELTRRSVEPLAIFTVEGRWHVIAFCRTADAERDFRVDRVRTARDTGESFVPRAPVMRTDTAFDPAGTVMTVRVEIEPEQRWALDRYPVREVEELPGGGALFTVDAAGEAWLERVLLRLGPAAKVVEPAGCTVGADAARELLAVYLS